MQGQPQHVVAEDTALGCATALGRCLLASAQLQIAHRSSCAAQLCLAKVLFVNKRNLRFVSSNLPTGCFDMLRRALVMSETVKQRRSILHIFANKLETKCHCSNIHAKEELGMAWYGTQRGRAFLLLARPLLRSNTWIKTTDSSKY